VCVYLLLRTEKKQNEETTNPSSKDVIGVADVFEHGCNT